MLPKEMGLQKYNVRMCKSNLLNDQGELDNGKLCNIECLMLGYVWIFTLG
jgi:hypothetical protein